MKVAPREFSGKDFSLHPAGPKFWIGCGGCPATFRARVPMVDNPTVRCPHCGCWNEFPFEVR